MKGDGGRIKKFHIHIKMKTFLFLCVLLVSVSCLTDAEKQMLETLEIDDDGDIYKASYSENCKEIAFCTLYAGGCGYLNYTAREECTQVMVDRKFDVNPRLSHLFLKDFLSGDVPTIIREILEEYDIDWAIVDTVIQTDAQALLENYQKIGNGDGETALLRLLLFVAGKPRLATIWKYLHTATRLSAEVEAKLGRVCQEFYHTSYCSNIVHDETSTTFVKKAKGDLERKLFLQAYMQVHMGTWFKNTHSVTEKSLTIWEEEARILSSILNDPSRELNHKLLTHPAKVHIQSRYDNGMVSAELYVSRTGW